MMDDDHIVIVGGGLAGCLLAIMMRRRGHTVTVFEQRADSRTGASYGGRSINLALSLRGLRSLDRVGLADRSLQLAIPMRGRQIYGPDGSTSFQPYSSRPSEFINSISRAGLNELLLDCAESEGVDVHFQHVCTSADFDGRSIVVVDVQTERQKRISDCTLIGADGAGSQIRRSMEEAGLTNSSSEFLAHGYKELTIPAGAGGAHRLPNVEALHIWPRRSFMLIALPNLDGSFTCTLFLAMNGPVSFEKLTSDDEVASFFEDEFPDIVRHMPDLLDEFRRNPVAELGTVRCFPWHVSDFALLVGDAAHAIVPFYGQGMNCAFEDCLLIDDLVAAGKMDWADLFASYERSRKIDTDAIADLALQNFVEMRDKVADPQFALRKRFELELARRFPEEYTPIYSHVTFSTIPYGDALELGETQSAALNAFLEDTTSIEDIDWERARRLVRRLDSRREGQTGNK